MPAKRPISLRDLLTFRMGLGAVMTPPGYVSDSGGDRGGRNQSGTEPARALSRRASPGSYGWAGGLGTSFYVDPQEDLVGILLTQRVMTSPVPEDIYKDFWTLAYQAIES